MQSGRISIRNARGNIEIGFNQRLSAARITNPNQPPEAILPTQLPAFFDRAFTADTSLALSGEQPAAQPLPEQPPEPKFALNPLALTGSALMPFMNDDEDLALLVKQAIAKVDPPPPVEPPPPVDPTPIEPPVVIPTLATSPLGYVFGQGAGKLYGGSFMEAPVNIGEDSLTTIVGNKGSELLGLTLINNVDFYMGVKKHELSYSDVWIGFSDKAQEANSKFDINDPPNALESGGIIFATNVHNTLDTLPAIDKHYTYRILPSQGSLDNASGLKSGIIKLNFSNSNSMFVKLVTNLDSTLKCNSLN